MAAQIEYLTREGHEKFSAELEVLRTVRRAEIAERLRQALEDGHGDIIDNMEFLDAKQEQSFVEGRILELEMLLSQARILEEDEQYPPNVVCRNRLVTVQQEDEDPEVFHIVGTAEANPREGKISAESPLGSALLGKRVGERVRLEAPGGAFIYQVLAVE